MPQSEKELEQCEINHDVGLFVSPAFVIGQILFLVAFVGYTLASNSQLSMRFLAIRGDSNSIAPSHC